MKEEAGVLFQQCAGSIFGLEVSTLDVNKYKWQQLSCHVVYLHGFCTVYLHQECDALEYKQKKTVKKIRSKVYLF